MNNINIRKLNINDYDEYINMSINFYDMPCCDHQIDISHFEDTFNYCIADSTYFTLLILEHNGNIAGYCSLAFSYSTEAGGHTVNFEEINIKNDYQGLGIAHKLFEFVFKNYPAKRYRLEATPSNTRAMKLYEKLGFEHLNYVQLIKDIKD